MPTEEARVVVGWVTVVRVSLALYTGDHAGCVSLARQALALLPETMAAVRVFAMVQMSYEYLVRGDVTPSTERLVAPG
jgi:ATP/maltotriose-dependent transcriptional regulator MalT